MRFKVLFVLLIVGSSLIGQEIEVSDSNRFSVFIQSDSKNFQELMTTEHIQSDVLRCYLIQGDKIGSQAILGKYEWKEKKLVFTSAVAPSENSRIKCLGELNEQKKSIVFKTASQTENALDLKVVTVYPTSNEIPINSLFFYVEFNQVMDIDFFKYQELKLFDSNGNEKQQVWRHEVNWDEELKIAAVMIHPGRVKAGIDYREEEGDVFKLGQQVQLVISESFMSTTGKYAIEKHIKNYTIIDRDTVLPTFYLEKHTPKAGTSEPLKIVFSEAMNFGSIIKGVTVLTENGELFIGKLISHREEKIWSFVPNTPWKKGKYVVHFNEYPSDLALNTIHQPFELAEGLKMSDFKSESEIVILIR